MIPWIFLIIWTFFYFDSDIDIFCCNEVMNFDTSQFWQLACNQMNAFDDI